MTLPWSLALAEEALGWRGTWILLGGLSFVFTVVPGLLILRQPEDVGLTMDGGQARPEGPSSRPVVEASLSAKQAFGTRQAWQLLCAHSLAFLSIAVLPTTFVPLFVGRGLSLSEASLALVAYGITSTFARLGWGYLLDRAGVRLTAIALAAYAAFAIALFLPETSGVIVAAGLAAVAGYAIGGILVVYPLLWPTHFGRLHLGAINGIVTPVASMAASSGPLILAVLYDASGTYHSGLLLLVAAWAVSILPLYAARQRPVALNQVPSS